MLKGLDPLVGPDLLWVLARMGHGDEIALVDANFPAASVAAHTVHRAVLQMDRDVVRCLGAVVALLPLDRFEPDPVLTMQVVGAPDEVPEVVAEAAPILSAEGVSAAALERFDFYARAKGCFAILRTLEERPYGNFILRKGTIGF